MTIPPVSNSFRPISAMDRAGVVPSKAFKLPAAQKTDTPLAQQLQPVAQVLIAQTFYGTLLKQSENSPFKDERFTGGREGQMWNSMLHQKMAERMTRGSGQKLVKSVVKSLTRKFDRHSKGAA